jgi:uncharacterized protein (DUF1330 family)
MSVQLIFSGVRAQGRDEEFTKYASGSMALFGAAGGVPLGIYDRVGELAGHASSEFVGVLEFADETTLRSVFESSEYQALVPTRDVAFERLDIIIAKAR